MKGIDRIWAYMSGKRSGKEANRLEREALSDPFLFEAVEGYSTVTADHGKVLEGLERKLKEKNRKKNKWVSYRWAVAASFLLVAGFAAWFVASGPEQQDMTGQLVALQQADSLADVPMAAILQADTVSGPEKTKEVSRMKTGKPIPSPLSAPKMAGAPADTSGREAKGKMRRVQKAEAREADTVSADRPRTVEELLGNKLQHVKLVAGKGSKSVKRIREVQEWEGHFERYVADSIRRPEEVRTGTVEGRVWLSIRVNRKGRLVRVAVVKGLSPECDREAVRLVKAYGGVFGEGGRQEVSVSIPFLKLSR